MKQESQNLKNFKKLVSDEVSPAMKDFIKQQETLEEVAERLYPTDYGVKSKDIFNIIKQDSFINGAKWQQEQYTIEEQHVGHTIDELNKEYIKGFNEGSAWQQERSYSEEDMQKAFMEGHNIYGCVTDNIDEAKECFNEWFEQFKNK
jgi:fructose-bisphosphate aldolase class 1